MEDNGSPSQTALTAAAARAAHLLVDQQPWIFADDLAAVLLGKLAGEFIDYHRAHGEHPVLSGRAGPEDLPQPVRGGPPRGRGPPASPSTSFLARGWTHSPGAPRWPRGGRLRGGPSGHPGVEAPAARGGPAPGAAGHVRARRPGVLLSGRRPAPGRVDPSRPALVGWLGVTMYLTRPGDKPGPRRDRPFRGHRARHRLPAPGRAAGRGGGYPTAELVSAVAAQHGEPWLTSLAPGDMTALLESRGFGVVTACPAAGHGGPGPVAAFRRAAPAGAVDAGPGRGPAAPVIPGRPGPPPSVTPFSPDGPSGVAVKVRDMPEIEQARRERLQPAVAALDADAALITSPPNVRYLTGLVSSNAAVLVPASAPGRCWPPIPGTRSPPAATAPTSRCSPSGGRPSLARLAAVRGWPGWRSRPMR